MQRASRGLAGPRVHTAYFDLRDQTETDGGEEEPHTHTEAPPAAAAEQLIKLLDGYQLLRSTKYKKKPGLYDHRACDGFSMVCSIKSGTTSNLYNRL